MIKIGTFVVLCSRCCRMHYRALVLLLFTTFFSLSTAQSQCTPAWENFLPIPHANEDRAQTAMTYETARSRAILFGGISGSATLRGDTWSWDGQSWNLLSQEGPSSRRSHAMAYDSDRDRVVLFGGDSSSGSLGDTWEWDGIRWTAIATDGPSPRSGHALAYDQHRHRTILFGGGAGAALTETWEWDGTSWTQMQVSPPSGLSGPALGNGQMIYDSLRERVVLVRGSDFDQAMPSTWSYRGTDWEPISNAGPRRRVNSQMAYDVARDRIVLYGGTTTPTLTGDTWEFDGSEWNLVLAGGPVRMFAAMVYDDARQWVLRLGGRPSNPQQVIQEFVRWSPNEQPVIFQQPLDATVALGDTAHFSVSVGPTPLTYQWFRNGIQLTDGQGADHAIQGSTTPRLTIIGVEEADLGSYFFRALNSCATVESNVARLSVRSACVADVDNGTFTGTPDGGVTVDDILYYLEIYAAGSSSADVDDGSATGITDGGVTIDDLLYFLLRFEAGC